MIERAHFREVKMAISECEMNLLGDDKGQIDQVELIKARVALSDAIAKFDRTCHKHKYVGKPPRADI